MAYQETTAQQLKQLLDQSPANALVLDVRSKAEYTSGHIAGTTNLPLSKLAENISTVPKHKELYVTCGSGHRSLVALELLQASGFTKLHNVTSGLQGWVQAGYPIVTAAQSF